MVTRHKVRDYNHWKNFFAKGMADAANWGMSNPRVFRSSEDPNELVVLIDLADIERAKTFMGKPEVAQIMQDAGVLDRPDWYYLNPA
ncbi:MAG: hypothetical protein ACTHOR_09480 [Devosia sp.]